MWYNINTKLREVKPQRSKEMKKYLKKALRNLEKVSNELSNLYVDSQDEEVMKVWEILRNVRHCFYKELEKNKIDRRELL